MNKLFIVVLAFIVFACHPAAKKTESPKSHIPEWSKNSVLYEVNIRQYTPEGTFKHSNRICHA